MFSGGLATGDVAQEMSAQADTWQWDSWSDHRERPTKMSGWVGL